MIAYFTHWSGVYTDKGDVIPLKSQLDNGFIKTHS